MILRIVSKNKLKHLNSRSEKLFLFIENGKINKKTVLQISKFTTLRIYQIPFDSYNTL